MAERVRICDIAEELGLSTATVSNVIHGKTGKVSAVTAERRAFYRQHLETFRRAAAVFAVSDAYAVELIGFLAEQGIRVPEDISVAGFNDTPICEMLRPALTTVRRARRTARRARRGEAARAQRRPPRRDGDHAARLAGGAKQHRAAQRIILHKRGAFILYSVMRLTFASLLPGIYNKEEKREVRYERTKRFL